MRQLGWLVVVVAACGKQGDGLTPSVSILAPQDGAALTGEAVDLVGLVTDGDGDEDLVSVVWSSSADGELAVDAFPEGGRSTVTTSLSPGVHALTLQATDSFGLTASDTVEVTVNDGEAPSVSIIAPTVGAVIELGSTVSLEGTTASGGFTPDALTAVWTLEAAGTSPVELATVTPGASGLVSGSWTASAAGEYTVVLTVADPTGASADAAVAVSVVEGAEEDADEDGVTAAEGDCDDNNSAVFPGASEACNAVDDDCDGVTDEVDVDGDGVVDGACATYDGDGPTGDCDDSNPNAYPGGTEVVDGVDNDCNDLVDDGSFTFDNDGDCYCGAADDEVCTGSINSACASVEPGDCNDADDTIHPGADERDGYTQQGEIYVAEDEDCDGYHNEGFASFDNDWDCYCEDPVICFGSFSGCVSVAGTPGVLPGDCDDFGPNAARRTPDRNELEDGIDNNCDPDGYIDEGTPAFDEDGDCFCASTASCADGIDRTCASIDLGDCDESDIDIHPGQSDDPEDAAPFVDSNCDGIDGDMDVGAFASPLGSGSECSDEVPCALATAVQQGAPYVLMSEGDHDSPGTLSGDVQLIGGYSADFTARSTDETATRVARVLEPVLTVAPGSNVRLDYLQVDAPTTGTGRGRRTVLIDEGTLTVNGVRIVRGAGEDGPDGFPGIPASSTRATRGRDAVPETTSTSLTGPSGSLNSDCNAIQTRGGSGGYTGTANRAGGAGMTPQGETASVGGGINRGSPAPGDGFDGATSHGAGGFGGTSPSGATRDALTGGSAGNGTLGDHGWGGAGGGGAGGAFSTSGGITIDRRLGSSGASGGTGGCRAPTAGFGAGTGGSSIGVWNFGGTLTPLGSLRIRGGQGGDGGQGGAPGMGQPGGLGGSGTADNQYAWGAGYGGDGGAGGNSGGGGGGRGGSVYGVLNVGDAQLGAGTIIYEAGAPGEGGLGGGQSSPTDARNRWFGSAGVDGEALDVLSLQTAR